MDCRVMRCTLNPWDSRRQPPLSSRSGASNGGDRRPPLAATSLNEPPPQKDEIKPSGLATSRRPTFAVVTRRGQRESITFGDASTVGVAPRPLYEASQRLRATPRPSTALNIYAGYGQDKTPAPTTGLCRTPTIGLETADAVKKQKPPQGTLRLAYDGDELHRLLSETCAGVRRSKRFECRPQSARGHFAGGSSFVATVDAVVGPTRRSASQQQHTSFTLSDHGVAAGQELRAYEAEKRAHADAIHRCSSASVLQGARAAKQRMLMGSKDFSFA